MEKVRHYKELEAYKLARALTKEIHTLTESFPIEEKYSLVDQIRRSCRSVGSQIAEAWGLKRYQNHFISKLTHADSERLEIEHWIDTVAT